MSSRHRADASLASPLHLQLHPRNFPVPLSFFSRLWCTHMAQTSLHSVMLAACIVQCSARGNGVTEGGERGRETERPKDGHREREEGGEQKEGNRGPAFYRLFTQETAGFCCIYLVCRALPLPCLCLALPYLALFAWSGLE